MDTEKFAQFARLRQFRSKDEVMECIALAAADKHVVVGPTHAVVKNGKLVGHFSVAGIPTWWGHLGKDLVTPHDTFRLIHAVESVVELGGQRHIMTLVGKESGLHPKMEELGYKLVGNADIFVKDL